VAWLLSPSCFQRSCTPPSYLNSCAWLHLCPHTRAQCHPAHCHLPNLPSSFQPLYVDHAAPFTLVIIKASSWRPNVKSTVTEHQVIQEGLSRMLSDCAAESIFSVHAVAGPCPIDKRVVATLSRQRAIDGSLSL
jgi:hypothetical protein